VSNWSTIVQRVLSSSGKPSNQADKVKLALVDAFDHHRHDHFYFNEIDFNFALVDNTSAYGETTAGFPKELLSIVGEFLFVDIDNDASSRFPVARRTQEELELCRAGGGAYTAQPDLWAFFNRQIQLYPTPNSNTDVLRGRALVDQWVPIVRYESGVWRFYKPLTTTFTSTEELGIDYPTGGDLNPWLTETQAAAMLRHYSEYLLWSQTWQATDGQDQQALMAYTQARHSLESRSMSMGGPLQVEPYPIGSYG
jgi:hypothetical protein